MVRYLLIGSDMTFCGFCGKMRHEQTIKKDKKQDGFYLHPITHMEYAQIDSKMKSGRIVSSHNARLLKITLCIRLSIILPLS